MVARAGRMVRATCRHWRAPSPRPSTTRPRLAVVQSSDERSSPAATTETSCSHSSRRWQPHCGHKTSSQDDRCPGHQLPETLQHGFCAMAHHEVIRTEPGARSRAANLAGAARPAPVSRDHISVAILADMLDERWVSMDLIADVLVRELPLQTVCAVSPLLVRPRLVPVIRRVRRGSTDAGTTADRVFNRFWLYRRALVGLPRRCDAFHIVDHSYAHLALALPRGRAVVTCHDTDTFRGFLTSGTIDTGLPAFLVRRLAAGLRRAAVVACPSRGTADDVIAAGLADAARVVVVPNGVDPVPADANAERELAPVLAAAYPTIDILHVGSTIPRKRIDLLLESFTRIVRRWPTARLLRVGGPLTADQQALAARLEIADRVLTLPFLSR